MSYRHRMFDSIEQVDLPAWQQIRSACNGSIVMDPRFIAAVERSIKHDKSRYLVLYDQADAPMACTSISTMTMDLANIADPSVARIMRHTPLLFSRLRHLKLLIGGLPIGTGLHTLGLAQHSASPQILPVLDGILSNLAVDAKADAIIYKEFGHGDLDWTSPLLDLGYSRIQMPPLYFFKPMFEDFAQYCAALNTRHRRQITRSTRKLRQANFEVRVFTDAREILQVYTSEVHALHHDMASRATFSPEVVPIEYLHQIALRLEGHVDLIAILKDARIVAFGWCLRTHSSYHMTVAGVDYQLNREFDLYFNLVYAGLDRALRMRVSTIVVGMGADTFKSRLGCYPEPLYIFVKGRGLLMSLIVRAAGKFLMAQRVSPAPSDIFKKPGVASSN
jgi:Acetyltransferase (GNAT) domain